MKKLLFLGPPGGGKGTQAKMLATELKIAHISMGDILREAIKNQTEVGKKAADFINKGMLVPDDVVNEIAKEAITANAKKGFILDGYPRTVSQAKFISDFVKLDKVVYIDVPRQEIVKRLSGRRSCKSCGSVYHIVTKRPKVEDVCDSCGGSLYIRPDDNEVTINKRFDVYESETSPLIKHYSDILVKINGVGELRSILDSIRSAI